MRAAAGVALMAAVLAAPVQAGASPAFELCRERVEAVRLAPAGDGVSVHVRLTESAAQSLARQAPAGQPVVVRAGAMPFARFVVRDALRTRPARAIQSTSRSAREARALERALRQSCSPTESC